LVACTLDVMFKAKCPLYAFIAFALTVIWLSHAPGIASRKRVYECELK
jgi:hypothetical protein